MKLANWLARTAATHPRRVALAGGGERITYAELDVRVAGAARRLAGHGVRPGDRVVLAMDASIDYAVLLHALAALGAVAVPLDPRLAPAELAERLGRVGPAFVVRDPADVFEAPEVEVALDRPVDLDAVHCVLHTSGSGGRARAVELTYGNHLWSALGSGARIGVDPRDVWLCCLPLHHVGGLAILMRSVVYGTGVLLERFDAEALVPLIRAERPTVASLVGTMLGRLLEAGAELDSFRCVLVGGGPVPSALIDTTVQSGVPLAPTYGLTEAASQVTTLPPEEIDRKPGSAGTPILPCEVRIEEGLIMVRGANVSPGAAGEDGWLRTGDLGRVDEEGHLYVLGRADELIVTGGENVSPEEVEQALIAHPAVNDAAVWAREDPEWQQAIVASVVVRDGGAVTADELRDFCRGRLAPFKVPKEITFAKRLPRNEQGKLERRRLQP